MDEAKKEIAIWAGVPLLLLIIFAAVLDNSSALSKQNAKLKKQVAKYKDYYLDQEATVPFKQALAEKESVLDDQLNEFDGITSRAMPALPTAYTTDNYTKASARATEDLEAVRKLAERSGVRMPAALPNADALAVDPVTFAQQMRQMYLFRQSAEIMIRDSSSGDLDIAGVNVGKSFTDASGEVAVFQLDYTMQIDFRSLERVLRSLNNNKSGVYLRNFEIELPDRKRVLSEVPYMNVSMSVGLLTKNDESWELQAQGAAASSSGASRGGGRRSSGGRF